MEIKTYYCSSQFCLGSLCFSKQHVNLHITHCKHEDVCTRADKEDVPDLRAQILANTQSVTPRSSPKQYYS